MTGTRNRIALAVAALAVAGCAGPPGADEPRAGGPGTDESWRRLPEAPLSPRDHAVVVGVGERALVVGGWEFLCPPNADCGMPEGPLLADGAVYDAATDSWTAIAPPPFGVRRSEHDAAAVGDTAWLLTGCADGPACDAQPRLLSYDLTHDRWTDHGRVPGGKGYRHLNALDRGLFVSSGTDEHGEVPDLVFEPAGDTWTELPDDPLPPAFDRFVVPVGDHLVLAGSSIADLDAGKDTPTMAARLDLETGAWTRLPDAPGQGYQLMPSDRGPVLNGHFIDSAGWLLDPAAWTWSELPDASGEHPDLSGVLDRAGATYNIPNSVGQMAATMRLHVYDSATAALVAVPPLLGREDVYDDSSTALGRDLFVHGGQRWSGDDSDGELMGDTWLWTAP
jgi:hypothetical protein